MLDIERKKVIEQLVKDTINKTLGPHSLMGCIINSVGEKITDTVLFYKKT